ncbi:capsular polysaccharide biosynthesis protein [Compostibacillus humi]|uniref:Capsular polysaccharide biosynthesis protein n=1 Tax=Compostibacillus humi TaxID=1245525 RepID=A0A8J2X9B1_9BACI|nr:Wzz/FepE/Etk N-terminal domain-containing protein [Compostibacillus humi]GFZ80019.1 capsular polysaccharide biosynthesis protein [Compostibacillus humi]
MEETISLKEIFEVIKKRLLMIISMTLLAATAAAIISYFFLTPQYENNSQILVNQRNMETGQVTQADVRTNVELINTYSVIIKSPRILDIVIEELNLNMTSSQLADKIQVNSAENSQVVTVTATDPDPVMATNLANATVQVFEREVPSLMNVDNVNILTEAMLPDNPSPISPNPLLNIAIAVVLGMMVGVGLAFLLEYLDNTFKSEEDIEKHLQLPVLGVVSFISEKDMAQAVSSHTRKKRGKLSGASQKAL